jgi:hypothetical protein
VARDSYERARAWLQQQKDLAPHYVTELQAFQAEAETLLKADRD